MRDSYTKGWLTEEELDIYREDLPLGTWIGLVEHTRYGKKKPGVHLYMLREGTDERYWTFVGWMGGNATYTLVKDNAFPGARFEFNFVERTTGRCEATPNFDQPRHSVEQSTMTDFLVLML